MSRAGPVPEYTELGPHWRPLPEVEAAMWLRHTLNVTVTCHRGVYWQQPRRRVFTPVHPYEPVPSGAEPPSPRLAYWATSSVAQATTRIPMTMITDLPGYDSGRLAKDDRYRIRRASRRAECAVLTDPSLLLEQGWALSVQAHARSGQPIAGDAASYRAAIMRRFRADPQWVLALVDDGRLLAYLMAHTVGSMLNLTEIVAGSIARRLDVGILLYWVTLNRAGAMRELKVAHLGPWFPERPNLMIMKSRFGTRLVDLPARGHMLAPARLLSRRLQPVTYYRVGGAGLAAQRRPEELRGLPLWDPVAQCLIEP